MEIHRLLRVFGVLGTILGVYHGLTKMTSFEDLAILILVALTLYTIGGGMKAKQSKTIKIEVPAEALRNGLCVKNIVKN